MPPKAGGGRWKVPPPVKAYEAMGALADGRINIVAVVGGNAASVAETRAALRAWIREPGGPAEFRAYAKCTSSSLDKAYDVSLTLTRKPDGAHNAALDDDACLIDAAAAVAADAAVNVNDNGAMFQGYVGYPAIALLVGLGLGGGAGAKVRDTAVPMLAGVPWKAIAKKHKNNWDAVVAEALAAHVQPKHGADGVAAVKQGAADIQQWIEGTAVPKLRRGGMLAPTTDKLVQKNVKRERE